MITTNKKNIVVIGGGTGTVSILNGLKTYADLNLSVIVSMMDDGGSNRVVRDEFGLLPLSDLRKSIIALAEGGNGTFRELFTYRFSKGEGLSGHTLGNLIMMALADISGSEVSAIEEACEIFGVHGNVIPVTLDDVSLVAQYSDGSIVKGEHLIDEPENYNRELQIKDFYLEPKAEAIKKAVDVISEADYIIAGPGDLYTSTLANIVVDGISEAIKESKGKYIFVNNLMTKKGQTQWMKASDLVNEISKYSERTPDYVLLNNREIPTSILKKYEESEDFPIEDDLTDENGYKVIRTDLIGDEEIVRTKGDTLVRSFVRHDSKKLAKVLYELFENNNY